jgi:hypothetical protein
VARLVISSYIWLVKAFAIEEKRLDQEEVQKMEMQLKAKPSVIKLRLKLLDHYAQSRLPSGTDAWLTNCAWIIKNRPTTPKLKYLRFPDGLSKSQGQQLVNLWSETIKANATNGVILGTAGSFFLFVDSKLALGLLQRAEQLEPGRREWSRNILRALRNIAKTSSYTEDSTRAVFDRADVTLRKETHPGEKNGILTDLVEFALAANNLEKARLFANAKLELAVKREISFRQFQAHDYLGVIALKQGDVEKAREELMLAADCEFYPRLSLAKEMLSVGLRDIVREFLTKCMANLNKAEDTEYVLQLENWIFELRAGISPNLELEDGSET